MLLAEGRFAILLHRVGAAMHRTQADHLDWLFESTQALFTIATDTPPPCQHSWTLKATVLPAHRSIYLDYEGPISGDRGSVTRLAGGIYRIAKETSSNASDTICLHLSFEMVATDGPFSGLRNGELQFDEATEASTLQSIKFLPGPAVRTS